MMLKLLIKKAARRKFSAAIFTTRKRTKSAPTAQRYCFSYFCAFDGRSSRRIVHGAVPLYLRQSRAAGAGLDVFCTHRADRSAAWYVRQCVQHLRGAVSGKGQRSAALAAHFDAQHYSLAPSERVPYGTPVFGRGDDPGGDRIPYKSTVFCGRAGRRAAVCGAHVGGRADFVVRARLGGGEGQPEAQE